MTRSAPLTEQETSEITSLLASAETGIDEFGDAVLEGFARYFQANQGFFYHFYDGRLHCSDRHAYGLAFPASSFPAMLENYQPFEPGDLLANDLTVYHTAQLYQFYQGRKGGAVDLYRDKLAQYQADWGLTAVLFDGPVLIAVAGIGRPFADGDFSAHDFDALRALHPVFTSAFLRTVANERSRRFGTAMAAAVEYHPHGVFVLSSAGEFLYANHVGRRLMQEETAGRTVLPMASTSTLVRALSERVRGIEKRLPGVARVRTKTLDGHEGDNGEPLVLLVAEPEGVEAAKLTARQRELLARLGAGKDMEAVCSELGISSQTLRVHLRNAYQRLGVSGLDEALFRLYVDS